MQTIEIIPGGSETYDAVFYLINRLDKELAGLYPSSVIHTPEKNSLFNHSTITFTCFYENAIVGCATAYPLSSEHRFELRRVYVLPEYRQKKVATRLIQAMEEHLLTRGATDIVLETGTLQPAAITLYARLGYQTIDKFGPYKNNPYSVCMRKHLSAKQAH